MTEPPILFQIIVTGVIIIIALSISRWIERKLFKRTKLRKNSYQKELRKLKIPERWG